MKHANGPAPGHRRGPWLVLVGVLVVLVLVWGALLLEGPRRLLDRAHGRERHGREQAPDTTVEESTTTTLPPYDGWVNPASAQEPWDTSTVGYLTFRGNPTRSWYGEGPVPTNPRCSGSTRKSGSHVREVERRGQRARPGAATAGPATRTSSSATARPGCRSGPTTTRSTGSTRTPAHDIVKTFKTGDLAKGSMTTDPDGYPLSYKGSRDNNFYVVATDAATARDAVEAERQRHGVTKVWNDDWDGAGLIIDDYLFEGGENSWFYIVKLNRGYDADGKVTVDPQVVFKTPGWDDELLTDHQPTSQFSIENSVAISGNTRLLRQLRRPGAGLGHQRAQARGDAHPGLPLLDRRRHRRHDHGRQAGACSTSAASRSATTTAPSRGRAR